MRNRFRSLFDRQNVGQGRVTALLFFCNLVNCSVNLNEFNSWREVEKVRCAYVGGVMFAVVWGREGICFHPVSFHGLRAVFRQSVYLSSFSVPFPGASICIHRYPMPAPRSCLSVLLIFVWIPAVENVGCECRCVCDSVHDSVHVRVHACFSCMCACEYMHVCMCVCAHRSTTLTFQCESCQVDSLQIGVENCAFQFHCGGGEGLLLSSVRRRGMMLWPTE